MPTQALEAVPATTNGAAAHGEEVVGSLDDLLAISDLLYETVYVPEWHVSVRLVSLSGIDRNRIAVAAREHAKRLKGGEDEASLYFQARIIAASMVDAEGRHIADQSRALELMGKSGAALTRLFLVAMRLSGIGDEALDEAVDDLKTIPSGDTGSD